MSTGNNKNEEDKKELERFLDHQIKLINEYSEGEEEFDKKLREKINTLSAPCQINILNKEWVEKWKEIVGYEKIKEKYKKINSNKHNENMKNELYDLFNKNNTKKMMEELGKIHFPIIKNNVNTENANNILFNENIYFIPMSSYYCSYLKKYIENDINATGSFVKGKCFLYNDINNKKEKKVLILEKRIGNNNDEFNALMVTLGEKEDIKKFINNVKNKTFEELMNNKNLKVEKREISQNKIKEIIKNKKKKKIEKLIKNKK